MSPVPSTSRLHEDTKQRGAYYTGSDVAAFLVRWAVRTPTDSVLDPSSGGGVFLRAACRRLQEVGASSVDQVWGVELDPQAHAETMASLRGEFSTWEPRLTCASFFDLAPDWGSFDAVVGNPPFIRYQRFNGSMRKKALLRAAQQGVKLSGLSSSWAPFLLHSAAMVKRGGRLAMVLPFEAAYAVYARPLFRYLADSFRHVWFLTFRERLFPHLNEETILLLAEGKGETGRCFLWRDLAGPGELRRLLDDAGNGLGLGAAPLDHRAICSGEAKLIQSFLPGDVRALYHDLEQRVGVCRLGDVANVGIGYVTGANSFFHLPPPVASEWDIPPRFLRQAVLRGRSLRGLRMTLPDWERGVPAGDTSQLLCITADDELPPGLRRYLARGEEEAVHTAYKCRSRSPWYCVPHVYTPEAFLTYMNGGTPRLLANDAHLVAPNTLHNVRIHDPTRVSGTVLAVRWHNSLTRLSCEIEGHALGGGMLKLEPREARRVLMPAVELPVSDIERLARDMDAACRDGRPDDANELADHAVLREALGLSSAECLLLRSGAEKLRQRRHPKTGKG